MYGTLITNLGYYSMWIRHAIGVVQPIWVGIKHTTKQRANGNSRITKNVIKISFFMIILPKMLLDADAGEDIRVIAQYTKIFRR